MYMMPLTRMMMMMMMMMMMRVHPSNRERGGLRDIFPKSSGPGR